MAKLFRKLGFVLVFAMLVGQFGSANVFADEVDGKPAPQQKEISSIEITNVSEPVPGKPLDTTATVTSAEEESWEIPVIWVDESGKTATVAEAGKQYFPTFAMYVPSGYKIKGTDASGKFPIKLPAFLIKMYGTDKILFIVDPASHLTYIFGGPGSLAGNSVDTPASNSQNKVENKQDKDKSSEEGNKDDDDDGDDEEEEQSLLEKYCAQSAIDHFKNNDGFLEWLVNVIINEIHPQAVDILMKGFPAYAEAAGKGELSSDIGLYIYNVDGEIDGSPAPKQALAFVQGIYVNDDFRLVMGIETSLFKLVQDDNGNWIMDNGTRNTFDNTIVHEMMHGFMYDYTRNGIVAATVGNYEYGYPFWFIEGTATAVENAYQYWYGCFSEMMTGEASGKYDADSVRHTYETAKDPAGKLKYDLNSSCPQENPQNYTTSAYPSGYLACLYLGYLDAQKRGEKVLLDNGDYDIDVIRGGLNNVLSQLHGTGDGLDRKTLGAIINELAPSRFKDTQDFQDKFIKADEDSNKFVANYLQMLEDIKTTGGVEHANGSILLGNDGQNSTIPITRGLEPGDPSVYRIIDKSGSAVSEINDRRANLTGGNTLPGNGTHDYFVGSNDEEQAAAAKPEDTASKPEEAVAAENAVSTETPVPETDPVENVTPALAETPAPEAALIDVSDLEAVLIESTVPAPAETPAVETAAPAENAAPATTEAPAPETVLYESLSSDVNEASVEPAA